MKEDEDDGDGDRQTQPGPKDVSGHPSPPDSAGDRGAVHQGALDRWRPDHTQPMAV